MISSLLMLLRQVKLQSQAKALPGEKPQFSGAFDATRQVLRSIITVLPQLNTARPRAGNWAPASTMSMHLCHADAGA